MELTCDRCGRSSFVPDDLVQGRAFRAKCPDCGGILDVPAERADALDDGDLAWLAKQQAEAGQAAPERPAPEPSPTVTESSPGFTSGARGGRRPAPAGRPRPVDGSTGLEHSVAQYERRAGVERRRRGLAIAAGALALVAAAGGVLVAVSARSGVGPLARRAREEPRPAPAAATLDAAGLAARAKVDAPAPVPAPPPAAPARRKTGHISKKDRKLLDLLTKKDDASVVAPEGDAMDSAAAGLDAEAVQRTIATNRKAFDACVSKALRLNPNLRVARRATLVVTVQPNGSVTGAFIAEEAVDRSDLGGCLSAAARRMIFPSFEGEATDVSMPLSLSAGL